MKKELIYTTILTIALSTTNGHNFANAQTDIETAPIITDRDVTESKGYEFSSQENILENIGMARVNLYHNKNQMAENNLDKAISELENISADSQNIPVQVVSFDYGNQLIKKNISIPVGRKITFDSMKQTIEAAIEKDTKINTAKVEYITFNSKKAEMEKDLKDAKEALQKNKNAMADFNLVQWQTRIVDKKSKDVPYLEKIAANIVLSRVMLQQKHYDAARSAVDNAKDTLKIYRLSLKDNEQKKQFGFIEDDLSNVSKDINKKDPNMIEKIDQTLDKWWQKINL